MLLAMTISQYYQPQTPLQRWFFFENNILINLLSELKETYLAPLASSFTRSLSTPDSAKGEKASIVGIPTNDNRIGCVSQQITLFLLLSALATSETIASRNND
jgi:hypothetical protein